MSVNGPYRGLPSILDARRTQISRVDDVGGGLFEFVVFIPLTNVGELALAVNFPMVFTEKPAYNFDSEVSANSPVNVGSFPTCDVLVRSWTTRTRSDTGLQLYAGVSLVFKITGTKGQQLECCAQFKGKGLVNPVQAI